ncbi:sodium:proline symporter, partial [Parageobacillus sp. SY1]
DLYKVVFRRSASDKELIFVGRLSVLIVALVASAFAYTKNDTILNLVGYAWAGFGASFGPVILLSLFWRRMTKWGAFAGMVAGAMTVILWTQSEYLKNLLYEMIPGFAASLAAIVVVSLLTKAPEEKVVEQFDKFKASL